MKFYARDLIWLTLVVALILGMAGLVWRVVTWQSRFVREVNTMFAEKEGDRRELEEKVKALLQENEALKARLKE